jgi:hypothetical protein
MNWVLARRPSPALVIAVLALLTASSGAAVAAGSSSNGDALIERGTLSGDRLRNHTLTGKQINLNKLGTVPSARHAASADTSSNADKLGGLSSDAYVQGHATVLTAEVVSNSAQLFSEGSLTVNVLGPSGPNPPIVELVNNTPNRLMATVYPGGFAGTGTDDFVNANGGTAETDADDGGLTEIQVFGAGAGAKVWTLTISTFPGQSAETFVGQMVIGTTS